MDQTCHANSGALGASGHNGICPEGRENLARLRINTLTA